MRRIYQMICCIIGISFFIGCKKDNYAELNKGNNPLTLAADKTAIILNQREDANDALLFSWTTGTNAGTDASIFYVLKIDKEGNNFSTPVTEDLGNALSKKYTVADLNGLLLSQWGFVPGAEASVEAKIIARVANDAAPVDSSAVITIKVTPYDPVSSTLYIIGDASPNGWNAGAATPLTSLGAGKFSWEGNLYSGEFKFITELGQFLPSYNKGADNGKLVYRTADSEPDVKFNITTPGLYTISLNLLDLTASIEAATTPPYTRLWMLGDATPTGWNIDAPTEMRVDSSNLFVFGYNGLLSAGEFKIPTTTGNFSTDYYMPLVNHQAITETGVQLVPVGGPDNKWQITTPGPYKIKLNLQSMKMEIRPFVPFTQIWMVGDASPVGWNIDSPHPMTADPANPYVFSYTGPMAVGEFKLPVETGDWGGDFFMPVINGSGPGSTQMKFVPGGNPDNKWKITVAGNYKITVNQLYETISIVKM
jgi:hypothetical protein